MPKPYQRKPGDPFRFRLRVPADLVSAVGRTHVERSLRTRDPEEAKRLFQIEAGKHLAAWEALRRGPQPIPMRTIMVLCGEYYAGWQAQMDEEPGESAVWEEIARLNQRVAAAGPEAFERWYGPVADDLLSRHGLCADPFSRARLIDQLHDTMIRATETLHRRAEGDYGPDPHASRFPPPVAPPSASAGPSTGEAGDAEGDARLPALTDLFAVWEAEARQVGGRDKTIRDYRAKMQALAAFVGSDRTADVTPGRVADWLDHLAGTGLSPRTIGQKYLAAIRAVCRAVRRRHTDFPDPTAGLAVRAGRPRITRERGLTDAEALGLLRAAREGAGVSPRMGPTMARAIRWVPWVCAFTGARVTEVAQARREDVLEVSGVPCLRITPEAGSVKTGEYRLVPLHPQLVREGFLAAVEALPPGPMFYTPDTDPSSVSRRLAKWVREHGGVTDRAVQPNHGWRHRFKTVCREADIAKDWADALQGHSSPHASDGYGDRTVAALYREVCKLPDYQL